MKEPQTYEIYYDKESDFLEVFLGEPTNCHTEEVEKGVFIRKDNITDEIKSIGILSFKKRVWILKQLINKFNLELPISIGL